MQKITVEALAGKLARSFMKQGLFEESELDLYTMGFDVVLSTAITAGAVFLLGLCLHNGAGALLFLLCFAHIRNYSGGYHASTRTRCFLISVAVYLVSYALCVAYAAVGSPMILLAVTLISVFIFYLKAPVENKNKRLPADWKRRNRVRTFVALIVWLAIAAVLWGPAAALAVQIVVTVGIVAALLLCA